MLNIRKEIEADYYNVEELAREAFWNLYFPGAHEHFVIHKMRNHQDFIPELSFVLEMDKKIVGAIFYTHSKINLTDGNELKTISFGPVFIAPKLHRQGFGRKLIEHSIASAKNMGYLGILTLGYPYHYKPYGFVGGKKYNISMADGQYYTGLLALPLMEDAFANINGYAVFSDVFEVNENDFEIYDKKFPFLEKKVQESQAQFAKACSELDSRC